jgi:hypothetical protein
MQRAAIKLGLSRVAGTNLHEAKVPSRFPDPIVYDKAAAPAERAAAQAAWARAEDVPLAARAAEQEVRGTWLMSRAAMHESTTNGVSALVDGSNPCFVAGTRIVMASGEQRNIEEIREGDLVVSYDEQTSEPVSAKVARTFVRETKEDTILVNGRIRSTANHPFYVGGKWVPAEDLEVGDVLHGLSWDRRDDGVSFPVLIAEVVRSLERLAGAQRVYNFEVERYHCYFADGVLVHNDCGPFPRVAGRAQRALAKLARMRIELPARLQGFKGPQIKLPAPLQGYKGPVGNIRGGIARGVAGSAAGLGAGVVGGYVDDYVTTATNGNDIAGIAANFGTQGVILYGIGGTELAAGAFTAPAAAMTVGFHMTKEGLKASEEHSAAVIRGGEMPLVPGQKARDSARDLTSYERGGFAGIVRGETSVSSYLGTVGTYWRSWLPW